jgi:hypothetical protein
VGALGRRKLSEEDAQKLVNAGRSARAKELQGLQSYYEGTQYDGRPAYLDQASNTPRLERKPCINYKLVKAAVQSRVDLAMGGNRFPVVLSGTSEDDSAFDPRFGLDPKDSETLDAFNGKLIDTCGLAQCLREAMRIALASRSVALIGCMRNGKPYLDPVWPKLCEPTFDPKDPDTVVGLEIRYRYIDRVRDLMLDPSGEPVPIVMEYRRVIDASNDTTYAPKEIWDALDTAPSKAVPVGGQIAHGFAFCPVWWFARQRTSYAVGNCDGAAIHDGMFTDIDGINHALSSRHLAALYAGDPMVAASGVDPDESFGTVGRVARSQPLPGQPPNEWDNALYGQTPTQAVRKSPGELWRAKDPQAKFYYVTLPPGALEAVSSHADDVCSKTREGLQYVWIDPEKLTGSGDISGKTLAFVFSNEVNAVNGDREDFGRKCLLPALCMVYRMLLAKDPAGIYVPGIAKALPILQKFLVTFDGGRQAIIAPQLRLKWGAMFEPSDVDESTRVSTAIQAKKEGVITTATAVEHVKDVFEIGNTDQYVDQLQKEAAQKQQDAMANAAAMATATASPVATPGAAKPPLPARGLKQAAA